MRKKVFYCSEQTVLDNVVRTMLDEHVGSVLVNRGQKSVGIITASDLLRAVIEGRNFKTVTAQAIMSHPLATCSPDDSIDQALTAFDRSGRSRLVVQSGDTVVGIIKQSIAERFKGLSGYYRFSPKTKSLPFRRGSGSTTS